MSKTPKSSLPSPDKPLEHPKDDLLGHAPFAETLAKSIYKMSPREGFVVALYGTWGSGKTTFLNFVQHYLKPRIKKGELIVIRFNPWWFSGTEDLTKRFFRQLQIVLGEEGYGFADLASLLADFANLVSEIPTPYSWIAKLFGGIFGLLGRKTKNINELKKKIEDLLKCKKQRILVIIDDIDRLTSDEIRELVRVVKAVGDFPYITYFLAFDKKVVVGALKGIQEEISGEDYLEKIVQVPFELPPISEFTMLKLFSNKLNPIIRKTPDKLFDTKQWGTVYREGIQHFLKTPRNVIRLINALSFTYPAVEKEVNPVDFIALETIRIFCSLAYDVIRKHFKEFTETPNKPFAQKEEDFKKFHDAWIEYVTEEDRKAIKSLAVLLFPELSGTVWPSVYGWSDSKYEWRKNLRICSQDEDLFNVYFRLSISEGSISNAEMAAILSSSDDIGVLEKKILELSMVKRPEGQSRVWQFLERMDVYVIEEMRFDHVPNLIKAFFNIGDEITKKADSGIGVWGLFDNDLRLGRVLYKLIKQLGNNRFQILKEAITDGQAIWVIVQEVHSLAKQHGAPNGERPVTEEVRLLTKSQVEELKQIAVAKIRKFAENKEEFFQHRRFGYILYKLNDWGKESEAKAWVDDFAKDDTALVELLERFWSYDPDGRINLKQRKDFLVPDHYIGRVRRLLKEANLTENQRRALEAFIKEFEELQKDKHNDSNLGESG